MVLDFFFFFGYGVVVGFLLALPFFWIGLGWLVFVVEFSFLIKAMEGKLLGDVLVPMAIRHNWVELNCGAQFGL